MIDENYISNSNEEALAKINKEALEKIEKLANDFKKLEEDYGDLVFDIIKAIRNDKES